MRILCGLLVTLLWAACDNPLENDPPSPPFVLDSGPTTIDAPAPIDAGLDAPIDAAIDAPLDAAIDALTATHPPFPMPRACVPVCLDGGV